MVSQILLKGTLNQRFIETIFILSSSKTTQKFDLSKFWASFWKEIKEISGNLDIYMICGNKKKYYLPSGKKKYYVAG